MSRFVAVLLGLVAFTSAFAQTDAYRWMEGPQNAKFGEWLQARGKEGRAALDASPALARWRTRLTEVSAATTVNRDQHRVRDRVFFLHLESGKQGVLRVRLGDGSQKVLFDPNTLPGQAHASITRYSVSPDGQKVAINIDRGGNEITRIEFFAVDTGQKLPDEIDHVWGEFPAIWSGNGSVFYTQMSDVAGQKDQMLGMRARYHKLGSPGSSDLTVAGTGVNPTLPLAPQEFPSVSIDPSSDWALLIVSGARAEGRACIVKTAELIGPRPRYRCIVNYDDEVQGAVVQGSRLYLQSVKNAPNGQVLALDLSKPNPVLADAKVLVREDEEAVLTGVAPARDGVYIKRMRVGIDSISRLSYGPAATLESIKMPYDGQAALFDAIGNEDGLVFTLQGWTQPRTLYSYDPKRRALTDLGIGANSPKDYTQLIDVVNTDARSLDGTAIPVTLLKPKRTGSQQLAILTAYGAYGIVVTQPTFSPLRLEWVAAGNMYVYAGIRGGGEKGDAWRLAGKGENKHHGIEDVVAAADMLVAQHYATRQQIALYGASAGGIIIGGAVDRFPDHIGAAIIHAGMLNPTRLAVDTNGANQYAEFGDPTTPAGLKQLTAMDAYVNIREKVAYPAVLLDVGLNDNRVAPWNSGKYGARLQAANTSPSFILFRTDADSGHFGTSISQEAAERADDYTFVEMTLGSAQQHAK
jgi:prolyl oligopeptidase